MGIPTRQTFWLAAAWSVVLVGPVSALTFICDSLPTPGCQPKRLCLHESVDEAWSSFTRHLTLVLACCALLWLARLLSRVPAARTSALLRTSLLSAALSTCMVGALLTGMKAVIDGRTDAAPSLLAIGGAGVVSCGLLWRSLRAAKVQGGPGTRHEPPDPGRR